VELAQETIWYNN